MCTNQLYTNASKCIFGAIYIPFLECFFGKQSLLADPTKVKYIVDHPVPQNQKEIRKWREITKYLHKYSANYA